MLNHADGAHGALNKLMVSASLVHLQPQDNSPVKIEANGFPIADSPVRQRVDATRNMQKGGEVDFKEHMMYDKNDKGYLAKTYEDHLRMKEMGYSHKGMQEGGEVEESSEPVLQKGLGNRLKRFLAERQLKKFGEQDPQFKAWYGQDMSPGSEKRDINVRGEIYDVQEALGNKVLQDQSSYLGRETYSEEGSPYQGASFVDVQEGGSKKGREAQYLETDKGRYSLGETHYGGLLDPVRNLFSEIPRKVDSGEDFSYQEGGEVEDDPVMFPAGKNIFGQPTEAMSQSQMSDMLLDMMTGGVGGTVKGVGKALKGAQMELFPKKASRALSKSRKKSKKPAKEYRETAKERENRLWSDTDLAYKSGDNRLAEKFLEEHGYRPYLGQGSKEFTYEYTDKGLKAFTPYGGVKSGIEQKTFKNPTFKALRDWMGYQEGGMVRGYQEGGEVGTYEKALQKAEMMGDAGYALPESLSAPAEEMSNMRSAEDLYGMYMRMGPQMVKDKMSDMESRALDSLLQQKMNNMDRPAVPQYGMGGMIDEYNMGGYVKKYQDGGQVFSGNAPIIRSTQSNSRTPIIRESDIKNRRQSFDFPPEYESVPQELRSLPSDSYGGKQVPKNAMTITPYLYSFGKMKTPIHERDRFMFQRLGLNPDALPPQMQGLIGKALLQQIGAEEN